jgi:hypothetical protein
MMEVLFNCQGIVYHEFISEDTTVQQGDVQEGADLFTGVG